jgi:hypothetical protein
MTDERNERETDEDDDASLDEHGENLREADPGDR